MAKKKKGKTIQMLSPEKYIMQKARSLPIHECWINSSWDADKLANITVARKHTNGNITLGSYLLDLNCLGVKDSQYLFNISPAEYRDLLEHYRESFNIEIAEYKLVHNIIFAGLEFAEDYGFKPHKSFALTQHIIEEDTEDIELMEIECGKNGKPIYIAGPTENEVRSQEIIAQLEKTAGPGNFEFIKESEDFDFDDDDDEIYNSFDELSSTEKLDLFVKYAENIEALNNEEKEEIVELTVAILDDYIDYNGAFKIKDQFLKDAQNFEIDDEINEELIFGNYAPEFDTSGLKQELKGLYKELYINAKKAKKSIMKLQKKYPNTPYLHFLELNALRTMEFSKYETCVPVYAKQFPDYGLIRILNDILLLNSEELNLRNLSFENAITYYFAGKKKLHPMELFNLFMLMLFLAMAQNNITQITTIDYLIEEMELSEEDKEVLVEFIMMARFNFITTLIDEKHPSSSDDEWSNVEQDTNNKRGKNRNTTFQFKIQIKEITHPPVWRRIKIPSHFTFEDLHYAIQISFGWTNSHLFQFSPKGFGSWPEIKQKFDDDLFDDEFGQGDVFEAHLKTLSEIFMKEKQKYTYIYDFGDSWEHIITLEKIEKESLLYPKLEAGKGKCPPEDCGGIWGYAQMKETMENPADPEYREYQEWLGLGRNEKWDPKSFDLEDSRNSLTKFFSDNN